jgi:hypothetical protein
MSVLPRRPLHPRSVRVQISRIVLGRHDIRNNRNVRHVGGDVDPNHMDAMFVLQNAKWIAAELVRVLHKMPVEDAVALIDSLSSVICYRVKHSNLSVYRRDILRSAHKAKLVEYDPDEKIVVISPKGVAYVEERLIHVAGSGT